MLILAYLTSAILISLAAIHMLWGFGFWVPLRDEERLVAAVVGARGVDRMPGPIPCGLVSAALLVIVVAIWSDSYVFRDALLWIASVVFLARGATSFTRFWRKMTPQEPFATLDRTYYGPLCLGLGVAVAVIVATTG